MSGTHSALGCKGDTLAGMVERSSSSSSWLHEGSTARVNVSRRSRVKRRFIAGFWGWMDGGWEAAGGHEQMRWLPQTAV